MTNAWSMLYDEILKMNETELNNYDYEEDDYDLENEYKLTLDIGPRLKKRQIMEKDPITGNIDLITSKAPWKYSEDEILKELSNYIRGTYNQHYSAGDAKIQTLDLIEACGDGESFCRSNILKYASRYDKKGTARRDIMKILHYAVLLMHFNDKNAQRETYNQ